MKTPALFLLRELKQGGEHDGHAGMGRWPGGAPPITLAETGQRLPRRRHADPFGFLRP